jgi:hypothetical protein
MKNSHEITIREALRYLVGLVAQAREAANPDLEPSERPAALIVDRAHFAHLELLLRELVRLQRKEARWRERLSEAGRKTSDRKRRAAARNASLVAKPITELSAAGLYKRARALADRSRAAAVAGREGEARALAEEAARLRRLAREREREKEKK